MLLYRQLLIITIDCTSGFSPTADSKISIRRTGHQETVGENAGIRARAFTVNSHADNVAGEAY